MSFDLEVNVRSARSASSRRAAQDAPMRLLLCGNFSGRRAPGVEQGAVGDAHSVQRVDVDTLERVLARIAPQITLPADGGGTAVLHFSSLDDFHPDRLFEHAAIFGRLRALRARLRDPSTFEAAAAELRAHGLADGDASEMPSTATAVGTESDAGTLQRLLGRESRAPATASRVSASPVEALIRSVVAPHITRDGAPQLPVYLEAVDTAIGAQMRQLLHAPAFRELEVAWRGVQWLVSRLELGEDLQLHLLDVTREELVADLLDTQRDPSSSAFARTLRSAAKDEVGYWTLLGGLFSIGVCSEDLTLLAALGSVASQAGAPIVAAATPALFGCHSVADLPDTLKWQPLPAKTSDQWAHLRHSAVAPSIGLVAPRVLLRLPYGKTTDPLERFVFEEQPSAPDHETLTWGPGSLAVALLLGQAFAAGGWQQVANPAQDLDDLPAYTFSRDGETQLQPCAEAWLGVRAGEALLRHGVMPLLSDRQAARVRLLRLQSIADPQQSLAGC